MRPLLAISGVLAQAFALAGCPDAVRAPLSAEQEAGTSTSNDASSATAPADAGSLEDAAVGDVALADAAPDGPHAREPLAAVSGNIALGRDQVFVVAPPGVVVVSKSGGKPSTVVEGSISYPIAVDDAHVYFVQDVMTLNQASYGGSGLRQLSGSADGLGGVTVDGGRVYFISSSLAVQAADRADGGVTNVRRMDVSGQPTHLALTDGYVVLAVWDSGFEIVRRAKTGDGSAPDTNLAQGHSVLGLRAQGDGAYWLEEGSGIRAVSIGGSTDPVGVTGDAALFDTGIMAVDATHVYWASRARGCIYRAARATGAPEVFAEGFDFPDDLVREYQYSQDRGTGRIAMDDAFVFVSDKNGLYRVAK